MGGKLLSASRTALGRPGTYQGDGEGMEGCPIRLETQDVCDSGGRGGYRLFAGEEMSKAKVAIDGMMNSDMVLYEKILDTPGFAFHFNELVKIALIEHGPEVSRNDIEAILENEKTTNAENIDALMDYLEAKGIKIEVEEVACDAIRALILASDKGPEVDREFVDKWRDIIFDYHEELLGEPTADNIVRAMLYEAGVTVKEDK